MLKRLGDRNVRIRKVGVLANQGNVDGLVKTLHTVRELLPLVEKVGGIRVVTRFQAKFAHEHLQGALAFQKNRDVVDTGAVVHGKDVFRRNVTEHGDFALDRVVELFGATASDLGHNLQDQHSDRRSRRASRDLIKVAHHVRAKTKTTQIPDTSLGRLGLLFTNSSNNRHERDVNQEKVVVSDAELELAHGLDERSRLDVADGAAELFHEKDQVSTIC